MLKRPVSFLAVLTIVGIAIAGVLIAEPPKRLSAFSGGPAAEPLTGELPPVAKGPMTTTNNGTRGQQVLSYDDGSCEAGLGAGATVTDYVDFDVPTGFTGACVVGVTARMNSGSAQSFAIGQAGAAPPAAGGGTIIPLTSNIAGAGPCPASGGMEMRAVSPGAAVITGSSNFFAGIVNTGFAGRDTNSAPAGRIWLNCATCGMTQYTPTDLSGIGLGGNWMIRVTVDDAWDIPVELMDFNVIAIDG